MGIHFGGLIIKLSDHLKMFSGSQRMSMSRNIITSNKHTQGGINYGYRYFDTFRS